MVHNEAYIYSVAKTIDAMASNWELIRQCYKSLKWDQITGNNVLIHFPARHIFVNDIKL